MGIGLRETEALLYTGSLAPSAKLLELGMVDAVVETSEDILPHALKEVKRWLKNPDLGRTETKVVLRNSFADSWQAGVGKEADLVWKSISDPRTVKTLDKVLAALGGGGKKQPAAKL